MVLASLTSAQCIEVSGAGTAACNDTYELASGTNLYGLAYYENASGTMYVSKDASGYWFICADKSPYVGTNYYFGIGTSPDLVTTWYQYYGAAPVPGVATTTCVGGSSDIATVTAEDTTPCIGNLVTLYVDGTLSSGTNWYWYKDTISGTGIDSGTSISITTPDQNATYYCRSENRVSSFAGDSGFVALNVVAHPGKPIISGCGKAAGSVNLKVDSVSGASYAWSNLSGINTWVNQGPAHIADSSGNYTSLAFDSDGNPYVAYEDLSNSRKLTVKKYNGSSWEIVGSAGFSAGRATYIDMIIDSDDNIYVGYTDHSNSHELTIMKYNGSWSAVGSAGFTPGSASNIKVQVDSDDSLFVAFGDGSNSNKLSVMHFDGSSWEYRGNSGFSAGAFYNMGFEVGLNDTLYALYSSGSLSPAVYKLVDTTWTKIGGDVHSFSAGYSALAINSTGVPHVFYGTATVAYCKKFNGSSWTFVGSSSGITDSTASNLAVSFNDNDSLFIAYKDLKNGNGLTVKKFNGSSWYTIGSEDINSIPVLYTSLGFDNSNRPYVAYADNDNSNKPGVLVYNSTLASGSSFNANNNSSTQVVTATYSNGCVIESDPTDQTTVIPTLLPTAMSTTYTADTVISNNGWAHYCNCENGYLLLSLDTAGTGAIIPPDSVRIRLGANLTYASNDSGGMIKNEDGYAVIDRRWDVSPVTQPTSNVGVRYYFTGEEYDSLVVRLANHASSSTLTSVTDMNFYKASEGNAFSNPHEVNGTVLFNGQSRSTVHWVYAGLGLRDHTSEFEVTSFSGGGGGGGAGGGSGPAPLPVELIEFVALSKPNHQAEIRWTTATEINNSHFVIERSYNGRDFEVIGHQNGAGNSMENIDYLFLDNTINTKEFKVYYRLRQVDFDGTETLTPIRKVQFNSNRVNAIQVSPNPFNGVINIYTDVESEGNLSVSVRDMSGKLVYSSAFNVDGKQITPIDLSHLKSGIYIISTLQNGNENHQRLIKD